MTFTRERSPTPRFCTSILTFTAWSSGKTADCDHAEIGIHTIRHQPISDVSFMTPSSHRTSVKSQSSFRNCCHSKHFRYLYPHREHQVASSDGRHYELAC